MLKHERCNYRCYRQRQEVAAAPEPGVATCDQRGSSDGRRLDKQTIALLLIKNKKKMSGPRGSAGPKACGPPWPAATVRGGVEGWRGGATCQHNHIMRDKCFEPAPQYVWPLYNRRPPRWPIYKEIRTRDSNTVCAGVRVTGSVCVCVCDTSTWLLCPRARIKTAAQMWRQ